MRILVVSQYFWPESFTITEVVYTLRDLGCDVSVLTGQPNYPDGVVPPGYTAASLRTQIHNGLTIHRVPLITRRYGSVLRLALNYLSFVVSATFFGPWLLRGQHVDVILVYAVSPILQVIPAVCLKWIKGAKLVTWVQDLWPDSLAAVGYVSNPRVLSAVELVVSWIYRHTDLLLVQSRAFEASVAALAPGKPIVYYPNSVDATFAKPLSTDVDLPEVPALDEGFAVVFAGNVGEGQAVEVIVECAALLRDVTEIRFIIFGQGSRWVWMNEQVQARGLTNMHLPGRFPVNTMPGLMQKADALLVTLADQPIFGLTVPNKVQAYMAAGRPILACLNGESARLVEEAQAGVSVPAQDSKALASAVLQLYRMTPEERANLGANGRRYFNAHFVHDKLVNELIKHFRSVSKNC